MHSIFLLLSTAVLAACAISSGVVEVEGGTYLVSARAVEAPAATAIAKTVVYEDARKYCAAKGARMYLVDAKARPAEQRAAGAFVNLARDAAATESAAAGKADLRFRCEQ